MKNLDLMKQSIITQIDQMSASEFETLVDALNEVCASSDGPDLNLDKIFTCSKCKKEFSVCHKDGDDVDNPLEECHQKFVEYANREIQ